MAAQIGGSLVFVACTQKSASCSPIWPDYCAVELLFVHFIFPTLVPVLAGLPLTLAMLLQLSTCFIYFGHINTMCYAGITDCKGAAYQYQMLRGLIAKLSYIIPFAAPDVLNSNLPPEVHCPPVLALIIFSLLFIISSYITFTVEVSTRSAYCAARRRSHEHRALGFELHKRKPKPWQIVLEIFMAIFLTANILTLMVNVWVIFYNNR